MNAATLRDQLTPYFGHAKPVTVTEFGCCTYRGAANRGGHGWAIADEHVVRDESEHKRST